MKAEEKLIVFGDAVNGLDKKSKEVDLEVGFLVANELVEIGVSIETTPKAIYHFSIVIAIVAVNLKYITCEVAKSR